MSDYQNEFAGYDIKISHVKMGEGYLEVRTALRGDTVLSETFTLASLGEVLGMPKSTLEGRYIRGNLKYWKVDIPMPAGRPARGFLKAQLQDVINILTTPGARVEHTPNRSDVSGLRVSRMDLIPTFQGGERFYTTQAIADHFGLSATAVRHKLQKSGLYRRMTFLGSGPHGGRPRRAAPASMMADVKMAIADGATFKHELDRMMLPPGARTEAREYVRDHTAPHTPPPRGSMRAFDDETLSPVMPLTPLNSVNSIPAVDSGYDAAAADAELAAALDELSFRPNRGVVDSAGGASVAGSPAESETPAKPNGGAMDEASVRAAEAAEREANLVVMRRRHLEALTELDRDVTAEELRFTAEMVYDTKPEQDAFIASVRAARVAAGKEA